MFLKVDGSFVDAVAVAMAAVSTFAICVAIDLLRRYVGSVIYFHEGKWYVQ